MDRLGLFGPLFSRLRDLWSGLNPALRLGGGALMLAALTATRCCNRRLVDLRKRGLA